MHTVHKPAIIETTKSLTGVGERVGLDVGESVGLDVGDFVGLALTDGDSDGMEVDERVELDGHTPSSRQA